MCDRLLWIFISFVFGALVIRRPVQLVSLHPSCHTMFQISLSDDHYNNPIPGGQIRAQLRPSVVIGYIINAPSRLLSATGHPLARTQIYLLILW